LGEELAGFEWFVLSGNTESGWSLEFYNAETSSTQSYAVSVDGTVQVMASGSFLPPGTDVYTIDREQVVVDSTDLPEIEEQENAGPPLGAPILILQGAPEGQIFWTIQNSNAQPIDATVAIEQ